MNLYLIGPMGAGKSEVGKLLAGRLGLAFADTDALVEERTGMKVSEIFRERGEESFRCCESEVIRELAAGSGRVVACGGGAVLRGENVELMRSSGAVFYLMVGAEEAAVRIGKAEGRPLLECGGSLHKRLEEIIMEREGLYRAAAHHLVDTGGRSPAEVAEEVARVWRECS